jgi:ABC-2 type transport system permease protein
VTGWRWRWQRIAAVMRLEMLLLIRDRTSLSLVAAVPVIQMLLFGAAVNLNPRGLTLAVSTPSAQHRALIERAAHQSGYFANIERMPASVPAASVVARGKVHVAVDWPGDGAPRVVVDASDPATVRPAAMALSAALLREQAVARLSQSPLGPGAAAMDSLTPGIDWLYNPEALTSWAIVPGLIGVIVMISMLLLGALTLVREREQGHWESLLSTAVDGGDALVGKLLPYLIIGLAQALGIALVAHGVYSVPVAGSLLALLAAASVFAAANLLLGFMLSAVAATQLQAIQSAVFFYLPSMLLSGFMFPFDGMPAWARGLGECLPLTHFVRLARGILLRGAGVEILRIELWPIALFGAISAGVALLMYRKHLQ